VRHLAKVHKTPTRFLCLWLASLAAVGVSGVSGASGVAHATAVQSQADTKARLDALKTSISEAEDRQKSFSAEAEAAAKAAEQLAKDLVQQGESLRQTEASVARLMQRIGDLETSRTAKRADLNKDQEALVTLIASMERLQRRPAAMTLLQPKAAITAVRSASVISSLVPAINRDAIALRRDLDALRLIETALQSERRSLTGRMDRLASEQAELNRLLALRRDQAEGAAAQAKAESARVAQLAAEAEDLESLLEKLLAPAPRPRPGTRPGTRNTARTLPRPAPRPGLPGGGSFAAARGRLLYPVVSTPLIRYGERDGNIKSQGLKSRARSGTQVRSPFSGRIVFSGPFRKYGQLLIIDHGGGYHSLLAGLGAIYAETGQQVLAGEPLGAVQAEPSEFYLELRHQGKAIDPAPWFQTQTAAAQ